MNWSSADLQILVAVVLFSLAACIALLMDYFKGYNDQLRERNIELAARQQERDRWLGRSPEAFVEKIAALLRTAQSLPAPASVPSTAVVSGASVRARHRAATYGNGAQAPGSQAPPTVVPPMTGPMTGMPGEEDNASPAETAPSTAVEPRSRSARARREPPRMDTWVSKEELEKLAERAARIRARYGAMSGEESGESDRGVEKTDDALTEADPAEPTITSPSNESAWTFRPTDSQPDPVSEFTPIPQTEEAEQSSLEEAAQEATAAHYDERAVEEPAAPVDLSVDVEPEQPAEQEEPLVEAPSEPSEVRFASSDEESNSYSNPDPEETVTWPIPSTPAQAAASAAVSYWETRSTQAATTSLESEREYSTGLTAAAVAMPDMISTGYANRDDEMASHTQNELDLDALFDQTYGSPSWLAMNQQSSSTVVDSVLPTGLFEGNEFNTLMTEAPAFTGVAVSIRINDFAAVKPKLGTVEGVEALSALQNLIRSLLREDRDFAGKAQEDEYVLLFPGDTGDDGQRRLFHLSERLWDFQLRSLGGLALMLSWGGLEVTDRTVPDAVGAARDRLEESRRGRAKPGATFRSARRTA